MRIVKLEASNFKRLRAVEITPNGDAMVVVSGRNAQGKSSVLDAIWAALDGGSAKKNTPRPIRDGETEAHVSLDLGDMTVSRKWTGNDKSYLTITDNADRSIKRAPQELLDTLVGRLSFDPLEFAGLSEKEQVKVLLDLVGIDFLGIEGKRQVVYTQRADVNRVIVQTEAKLKNFDVGAFATLPAEKPASIDITGRLNAARSQQTANDAVRELLTTALRQLESKRAIVSDIQRRRQTLLDEIARLDESIILANDAQEAAFERASERESDVGALEDPDVDTIMAEFTAAQALEATYRARDEYQEVKATAAEQRAQSQAFTDELARIDDDKRRLVADAKLPVDGLTFDETGVIYQGIPFKQASSAEQLRVSLGMAMALNPTLRVIRITDGSLLDSENMALVASMARDNDYQVWCERVSDTGEVGVVIEDGQVMTP